MTDQTEIARVTKELAELSEQIAVQREQMKTMKAEYEDALDRLRAEIASNSKQQLLAILGIVALATTILGILITTA